MLGTITEPSGQVTTLGYDGRRRLTSRADGVGTISYTLDNASQVTAVTQGTAALGRTYHGSGQVATYTNANSETLSYDYDKNGNLVSLTYPAVGSVAAATVTYGYDQRDRLTSVTDWAGRVTSYTWDAAGRLTQVTRANGTKRTLRWDAAGQLLAIEERPASGVPLLVRSYGYDAAGRVTKRLGYPQASAWSEPAWTASYDNDNRLTTLAGATLSYDLDGNLLGSRLPDGPWGSTGTSTNATGTYTWNARNQLTRVVRSGSGQQLDYTYDAEGNLIQTVDSVAGTTRWIIDPNGGGMSRVLARVSPGGQVTRYVYGLGLIDEVRQDGTLRYYHYDQTGSTIGLTDATGVVKGTADYSPYGGLQSGTGELANASTTPFLFVGAHGVITDAATGLQEMRARWYSTHLRRFISEDPAGFAGGENFYAYAGGNPVSLVDPSGLVGIGIEVAAGAEAGLATPIAGGITGSAGFGMFNSTLLGFIKSGFNSPDTNTGGLFASGGAFIGKLSAVSSPNGYKTPPVVLGATAGVGVGLFITNARNVTDLRGAFDTGSLNIPAVGIQVSWGHADDGKFIWNASAALGRSAGGSLSGYPTTTITSAPLARLSSAPTTAPLTVRYK